MVGLQRGFGVAASQTPVAVLPAQSLELLHGKIARAGVPRSPPLARIVGLGLPDLLRVLLTPLLAAGDCFVSVEFVVLAFRGVYTFFVLCRPTFLVLGDLLFVFFPVLPSRLDSMWQVCSGFIICRVLLRVFTPILLCTRLDANLALRPPAPVIEPRKLFRASANRLPAFCTWKLSGRFCSPPSVSKYVRYAPIDVVRKKTGDRRIG
jgi:hypothetical protein